MNIFICAFVLMFSFLPGVLSADQVKVWNLNPSAQTGTHNVYEAQTLLTRSSQKGTELLVQLWDHMDPTRYTQVWVRAESQNDNINSFYLGDPVIFFLNIQDLSQGMISSEGAPDFKVLTDLTFKEGNVWLLSEESAELVESSLSLDGVEYQVFPAELLKHNYRWEEEENYNDRLSRLHYLQLTIAIGGDDRAALSLSLFEDVYFGPNRTNSEGLTNPFLNGMRKWEASDSYMILINRYYPGFWWVLNTSKNQAAFSAQGRLLYWETNLWSHVSR